MGIEVARGIARHKQEIVLEFSIYLLPTAYCHVRENSIHFVWFRILLYCFSTTLGVAVISAHQLLTENNS